VGHHLMPSKPNKKVQQITIKLVSICIQ
jgi:hypothetical protein